MLSVIGAAVALTLSSTAPARAETVDLTPAQETIFQIASAPGGYVTREMHRDFWRALPAEIRDDPNLLRPFTADLRENLTIGARFQRALWRSAELSYEARSVVTTETYSAARNDAAVAARRGGAATQDAREETAALLALADRLLTSAATRETLIMPDGITMVTPALIERVISNLDATEARIALLLTPRWAPQPVLYREPLSGVTIQTVLPFSRDVSSRTARNGADLKTVTLSRRDSETDFLFITITDLAGPWRNPVTGLQSLARSALATSGTMAQEIESTEWRNRHSAVATGSGERDGTAVYSAVRIVDWPERKAALAFIAVTTRSAKAAARLRDDLVDTSGGFGTD